MCFVFWEFFTSKCLSGNIESGGNVFADMGLPDPEGELTKAQLAGHIRETIRRRRLTQIAASGEVWFALGGFARLPFLRQQAAGVGSGV